MRLSLLHWLVSLLEERKMRVFSSKAGCTCLCVAAIGMLSFSSVASALPVNGGTIEMVAVSASDMSKVVGGAGGLGGNNVDLLAGGLTIQFEVQLSGWNQNLACQIAKGYQIDFVATQASQYAMISSIAGAPDVVLACDGACAANSDYATAGNKADSGRADFLFAGTPLIPVGPTVQPTFYRLSGATIGTGVVVESAGTCASGDTVAAQPSYGGDYFFDVPAAAAGVYQGVLDPIRTQFTDEAAVAYQPSVLGAPSITVVTGRCCHNLGTAGAGCTDDETLFECTGQSTSFTATTCNTTVHAGGGACVTGAELAETCDAPPALGNCPVCTNDAGCTQSVCSSSGASCQDAAIDCGAGETCDVNKCAVGTCITASLTCIFNNVQGSTECCDPSTGAVTGNALDGDTCSDNLCSLDGVTGNTVTLGSPFFPPAAANTTCNDGRGCTENDVCDGTNADDATGCAGSDINGKTCATDADCAPGFCDPGTSLCVCSEDTSLTLEILGKTCTGTTSRCQSDAECGFGQTCDGPQFPVGNCLADNSTVDVAVHAGPSASVITGGQFLVTWDTACLVLDQGSVGPCGGGTLSQVISAEMNPGSIFYAAIDSTGVGSSGNEDLFCMSFTKQPGCGSCDLCFDNINPRNTILSSNTGNPISLAVGNDCSKPVRGAGVVDLTVPASDSINVNCNEIFGTTSWNSASATDTCDGALALTCVADFVPRRPELAVSQAVIDSWIMNGGDIPQGTAFFRCDTINSCGTTDGGVWTVDVTDQETVDVVVQLEPAVDSGNFTRAIEFAFYNDCAVAPVSICRDITFNTPFDFPGHGSDWFKAPKGNYTCVTAKDPYHSLRSGASIESVGGKCTLAFKGDPIAGGSWLRGGNLDCRKNGFGDANTVNIIDFSAFLAAQTLGSGAFVGSTTCVDVANRPADEFNADIDNDGDIDMTDFGFILDNFLMVSKTVCCGNVPGANSDAGDSISVKELRLMGLGDLAVADLNSDGFVNLADMELYMQGARPSVRIDSSIKGRVIRGR